MRERYVLLGLARARAEWFRTISQWATSAMLPAEFVRCVSVEELRTRLASGRPFSTAIVDGSVPGLDRDLIGQASEVGVSVVVVDDGGTRDWRGLGAAAVVPSSFSRDELLEVLAATSEMVGSAALAEAAPSQLATGRRGDVIVVTGPGGTGASTVAIALAQGLATGEGREASSRRRAPGSTRGRPSVLLADLCRSADQAMLHDSRVVVPSIQEIVEAHRTGVPPRSTLLDQTFDVPARGYRLLLGLRRSRQWAGLRTRALESALDSLQHLVDIVVADVEPDLEGEADTGSIDIEVRNLLARASMARASVVVVVGEASMKGLYALVRAINEIAAFGVPTERILPVINRAPRRPRARAELTSSLTELMMASVGSGAASIAPPLYLPDRAVEEALRDGVALPGPLPRLAARAVAAVHARAGQAAPAEPSTVPRPVAPGSLSAFTQQRPTSS